MPYVPSVMTLFETISGRIRAMFRRQPEEDSWLLPGNEVTRAVESGRNLAAYDRPITPATGQTTNQVSLDLERLLSEPLPPLDEPARKIVISDDAIHAPLADSTAEPSEKPLEAKAPRKRWWRRAA